MNRTAVQWDGMGERTRSLCMPIDSGGELKDPLHEGLGQAGTIGRTLEERNRDEGILEDTYIRRDAFQPWFAGAFSYYLIITPLYLTN